MLWCGMESDAKQSHISQAQLHELPRTIVYDPFERLSPPTSLPTLIDNPCSSCPEQPCGLGGDDLQGPGHMHRQGQ